MVSECTGEDCAIFDQRFGEGALGGTPQKKLRSRYETGDRQGQQTFLSLRVLLRAATSLPETTSGLYNNSHVICFDSFIVSTASQNPL